MNEINEIKRIRAEAGLTQVEFAKKYGIPRRTIESWEVSQTNPTPYLVRFLEFYVKNCNLN